MFYSITELSVTSDGQIELNDEQIEGTCSNDKTLFNKATQSGKIQSFL